MHYAWHLYLMGAIYFLAGLNHFRKPKLYLRIMPPYLPVQKTLVYISGIIEIALGIGVCFPATKNISIYGIIAMLIVFLLVHFHMLSSKKAGAGLPRWLLILRLPLQLVLIWWAWFYLKL